MLARSLSLSLTRAHTHTPLRDYQARATGARVEAYEAHNRLVDGPQHPQQGLGLVAVCARVQVVPPEEARAVVRSRLDHEPVVDRADDQVGVGGEQKGRVHPFREEADRGREEDGRRRLAGLEPQRLPVRRWRGGVASGGAGARALRAGASHRYPAVR